MNKVEHIHLEEDLRAAMRGLTASVNILTTINEKSRFGIAVTSATAVCMTPPTISVCVNWSSRIYGELIKSGKFSLNALMIDQENVANAFGGKVTGEDRFLAGDWKASYDGLPVLLGAQSTIFASVAKIVPFGTHAMFFGIVVKVIRKEGIAPLLYEDGGYAKSARL